MNECGGDQDTRSEMLAEEENLGWDFHPADSFGDDRKSGTWKYYE